MRTPPIVKPPQSKLRAARLLAPGWKDDAVIREAVERPSARGNDMIELDIAVPDGRSGERMLKDFLTNTSLAARSVCAMPARPSAR